MTRYFIHNRYGIFKDCYYEQCRYVVTATTGRIEFLYENGKRDGYSNWDLQEVENACLDGDWREVTIEELAKMGFDIR